VRNLLQREYVIVKRHDGVSLAKSAFHNSAFAPLIIRVYLNHSSSGYLVVPTAKRPENSVK
jgi:hypothetical protein